MTIKKLIDWKRNLQKSLFMSFSIMFLSLITWGGEWILTIANGVVIFILAFVSNSVVDLFFYYKEKKQELKNKLEKEAPEE